MQASCNVFRRLFIILFFSVELICHLKVIETKTLRQSELLVHKYHN